MPLGTATPSAAAMTMRLASAGDSLARPVCCSADWAVPAAPLWRSRTLSAASGGTKDDRPVVPSFEKTQFTRPSANDSRFCGCEQARADTAAPRLRARRRGAAPPRSDAQASTGILSVVAGGECAQMQDGQHRVCSLYRTANERVTKDKQTDHRPGSACHTRAQRAVHERYCHARVARGEGCACCRC